jgi:hypothetical protein
MLDLHISEYIIALSDFNNEISPFANEKSR